MNQRGRLPGVLLAVVFGMLAISAGRADDPPGAIDWNRARQLLQKERSGQALTAEEKAFLDHAKAVRRQAQGDRPATRPDGPPQPPVPRESTGLVPLTDMSAQDRYQGEDGGLYGGGQNEPPKAHAEAAMKELAKIAPLDAEGRSAADGKIVLLSIGMSNTTQEFSKFKELADRDPAKRAEVVIVDCAQGGQAAAEWDEKTSPVAKAVWGELDRRLKAAGATSQQVQAVWIKQAIKGPARLGQFPAHAKVQKDHTVSILQSARARFPNLRVAYLSSRIYGGYATGALNPEPFAYEGAYAVRWVILDQMRGEAGLNWDPAKGEVKSPIVLWGPYLWADGLKPRKSDGLTYRRADFAGDGVHPSAIDGRTKVAEQLLAFFKTDPLAKGWFARAATPPGASSRLPADPSLP